MKKATFFIGSFLLICLLCGFAFLQTYSNPLPAPSKGYKVQHTTAEWHKILTPEQFNVLREGGTENAYSGKLLYNKKTGIYYCAACGQALFKSSTKYDAHEGWPSFWQVIPKAVVYRQDNSFGMDRTEVLCSRCGSHLGHLFGDGPKPTGLRFCIDSLALKFKPTFNKDHKK